MNAPAAPLSMLDRLKTGSPTATDIELIKQLLMPGAIPDVAQLGKYNFNTAEGKDFIWAIAFTRQPVPRPFGILFDQCSRS